ncbi:DNA methyltransferase [Enterococcus hulanensis]|uniref:DNA-methyltransferase n=1 Tax=Enterococcus hulanensis TaxID=2559929 RepID=UPI00288EC051|nr:DNA methyltransferase [Enterococcus hulanensis]MDT2663023.1 DNA methyltransferase [Enterococcus hulanensis]
MFELNKIYNEDCLIGMQKLPDKSIDMILCDLPYGTTANSWDSVIPFDQLWLQYERIIKDNGAIVLTAQQPFTTELIASNRKLFRYEWIWDKKLPTGFLNANKMPLKRHENILVFYKNLPTYNPEMVVRGTPRNKSHRGQQSGNYGHFNKTENNINNEYYPTSIIVEYGGGNDKKTHPTQKPVALFEYLIKTYTNKGEIVLDSCMGSATTAIACLNTDRSFIGFETNRDYFEMSLDRIKNNTTQLDLFG